MRVVIDKYIPFLRGVLEAYGEVLYLAPEEFTPQRVHDADALIVRTRTAINRTLLVGSRVRFVATATIGYDHIDQAYCRQDGIAWTACPGCNAQGVCDYVEEVLDTLDPVLQTHSGGNKPLTVGVVGYGHVGTLVAAMARRKGYGVLVSDPPKGMMSSAGEIARNCEIITFHTPLTHEGQYPTYHLADEAFFEACKPNALIINAARGGVVDEQALLRAQAQKGLHAAIDCWEDEPYIKPALLAGADLASCHIAGYTVQGKMRASMMCLQALCDFFALPALSINRKDVPLQGDSARGWLQRITQTLKENPDEFEHLRKQYRLR